MIKIAEYDHSTQTPIPDSELASAGILSECVLKMFQEAGIEFTGEVEAARASSAGAPSFRPMAYNRGQKTDMILLAMKSLSAWDQFIFQFSHEFTHAVIYQANPAQNQEIPWAEETICEAMSLYALRKMSENWDRCPLSDQSPRYWDALRAYLSEGLKNMGSGNLSSCLSFSDLEKISDTCRNHREDRKEEMRELFWLIRPECIPGLMRYRDFVALNSPRLDTRLYRKAYPKNEAVRYLCWIQDRIGIGAALIFHDV